jgi:hypothetical protein
MKTIEAGELRIGNWIQNQFNVKYIVKNIYNTEMIGVGNPNNEYDDHEPELNFITGTPLNEDILLKCGFKLATDEHIYVLHDTIELTQTDYGNSVYFMGNYLVSDVKYLHQLQNLYFALTNQELQINFDM